MSNKKKANVEKQTDLDDIVRNISEGIGEVLEITTDEQPETAPEEKETTTEEQLGFTKQQILKSHWYSHRRDLLKSQLEDDKPYTHKQINDIIENFMEKKVE